MRIVNKIFLSTVTAISSIAAISTISNCSCSGHKLSYTVAAPTDTGNIKKSNFKKVYILAGQSNAVGVSRASYLQQKIPAEDFNKFNSGIEKVKIASVIDGTLPSTQDFKPTTFFQFDNSSEKFFGIELGFADVMNKRSDEDVFLIKYAMGASVMDSQWMDKKYNRGVLYNNMVAFIKQQLTKIENPKICGFCWMQGESDTNSSCAKKYLQNTTKFVSYLRNDLAEYSIPTGFTFVDAGIATNWGKYYDDINYAKINYWKSSKLNGYFSTTENGLTNNTEPVEKPDTAHYDSTSELLLGQWFAYKSIELYNSNNQ